MSKALALFLVLFVSHARAAELAPVPVAVVADTINPGSASYIAETIHSAERARAPYVVIQLDTPGGLLSTTRHIVQEMLGAKIPVVVFIGPRGAQAGSAGAIITFAADVAAMAPGSNIGAAHPVSGSGEKMDDVMKDKVANDTAAFAESLARTKGRNTEWAVQAVKKSASIPADEALKKGVVDLIADDLPDLAKKLSGWKLRAQKAEAASLPEGVAPVKLTTPSIKQRLVSFFADPNLAYLIMSLGGLCLFVEISHPGLILPGILGVICIILSLVSFQALPIDYGALALIFVGMGMLLAELFLPTFGLLGVGGIACFIFGSLFLMDTTVPEFRISLGLILPTAAVLAAFAFLLGVLVWRARNTRLRSGIEAMVGEFGEVREPLSSSAGKVFVRGELWNAVSRDGAEVTKGALVSVVEVRGMVLVVAPEKR